MNNSFYAQKAGPPSDLRILFRLMRVGRFFLAYATSRMKRRSATTSGIDYSGGSQAFPSA